LAHTIHIEAGSVEAIAELNATHAAQAIWQALPIKSEASIWGEEVYFSIPVYTELEAGSLSVKVGDLAYWPTGNAFCIFFGPTPISPKNEIRPASSVTVFGRIIGDAKIFKSGKEGAAVVISRHEESKTH
jgi:hypothetical protein